MKRLLSVILAVCLGVSVSVVSNVYAEMDLNSIDNMGNDPWLSYGHDYMATGASTSELGEDFEESEDWPFDADAGNAQSLCRGSVAYNGILYTALYDGSRGGNATELIAVEIETGEEIWRQEAAERLSMSTPVIDPDLGLVYVASTGGFGTKGTGSTVVSAFTLEDGDEEWSSEATGAVSSPLAICNGYIYFKTMFAMIGEEDDEFLYKTDSSLLVKMDAETGDVEWESDIEGGQYLGWSSPCAVVGDYVLATTAGFVVSKEGMLSVSGPAFLYCVDIETGDIVWDVKDDLGLGSAITADEEYVYFLRGRIDFELNEVELVFSSFEVESGSEEWEWTQNGTFTFGSVPVCNEEYVCAQDRNGKLWVLNKEDGDVEFSKGVGDTSQFENMAIAGDYIIAYSPEISNNRYTGDSELVILNLARKGKRVWQESVGDIVEHVAVYGNRIFFTGNKEVFCYEALAPKLVVDPEKIQLDEVERNTKTDIKLALENDGVEGLEGTVETDQDWLTIDIEEVNDDVKEATVTINTWDLDPDDYSGRITFTTNGGKVIVPVLITVVDEEPPTIEWDFEDFTIIDEVIYTNQKEAVLKGKTEPTAFIYINEEEVELDAEGYFEFEIELEEGENKILVEKEDDIGNTGEEELVIILDTKAPELDVTTKDYAIATEENFYIIGQCDEEEVVVTLDDEEIELGKAGKFAIEVTLERGVNTFELKATDVLGNETVVELHIVYPEKKIIILQIGNTKAEVNGVIVTLEAPPSIINGRTMVPLRFVSETFGAELGWDGKEQKITLTYYGQTIELWIGRKTSMVNGEPMILDAPPTIINGRTMVPLRFCAETFGAEVGWDGGTQTITLIYPKQS